MRMSEPKKLHPISAVLNALKQLKEMIIPLVAFVVFGSRGSIGGNIILFAGIASIILVLAYGVISWFRYTYRIEENELRIEYGIIVRKKRYIPLERIQSLDLSEGILHRPFGLVKVRVETAGSGGEAEAVLTAVLKEEAIAINNILQDVKNIHAGHFENEEIPPKHEEILYKISGKELLMLASTSGGVGVVLSAVIAFISQFDELIPYEKLFKNIESFYVSGGILFISLLVFIGFFLAWVIAVISTMLKYANFTLKRVDDDFIISRGLLEKRQTTIPLKRVQAVRITENLIRQPLRYASVYIESAGGSGNKDESARVTILPFIKKNKIHDILQSHLEGFISGEVEPAPKRAFIRYCIRGWMMVVPVIIAMLFLLKIWGLLFLLLLPLSAFWSYLVYRDAGWRVDGSQLILTYRSIVKHTVFMSKNKIQSIDMKESYFQRKKNLSTIEATVKSGLGGTGGEVVDLEKADVIKIYSWYSKSVPAVEESPAIEKPEM